MEFQEGSEADSDAILDDGGDATGLLILGSKAEKDLSVLDNPGNEEEIALFNKVMGELIGVDYVATEVSSQVVEGTNYKFRAIGTIVNPEQTKIRVLVHIFEPLPGRGEPYLVSIADA